MNNLPHVVQMLIVGCAGAIIGGLVNWAIHSLGFFERRAISPWSPAPSGLRRHAADYLPVVGWLCLRREAAHWGRGHWIRPLLIELGLAVSLAWLFQAEMAGDLLPAGNQLVIDEQWKYAQFVSRAILMVLMTVATFIDFDEKTIPDTITIPGTLLGLTLAACWPYVLPPIDLRGVALQPLWLSGDFPWPIWLNGLSGLLLGLSCFIGWCYALVPKLVTLRRGWWKGWLYLHASTFRTSAWRLLALIALVGSLGIIAVWYWQSFNPLVYPSWPGLLTSLVGMAFGGGMIWAVRIVGWVGLRKEAMGFGDVTLMAMIGSFLGWQASIMVFFLAPLAAVVIAVMNWAITRRRDIAFGPYLCCGALLLILKWTWLWEHYGRPIFGMGWFVPAILGCALAAMLGLLMLMRIGEEAYFRWRGEV